MGSLFKNGSLADPLGILGKSAKIVDPIGYKLSGGGKKEEAPAPVAPVKSAEEQELQRRLRQKTNQDVRAQFGTAPYGDDDDDDEDLG